MAAGDESAVDLASAAVKMSPMRGPSSAKEVAAGGTGEHLSAPDRKRTPARRTLIVSGGELGTT